MLTTFRRSTRPLTRLLPVVALVAALGPVASMTAPVAAATEPSSVPSAETALVAQLNQERAKLGLVALQVDPRLMVVARARSADMIDNDYFAHEQPDGRTYADRLAAAGIATYASGETLARDHYPTLAYSVAITRYQWMQSPEHRAILMSSAYNYIGVGLAMTADGLHKWTAIVSRAPDRTGATARGGSPVLGARIAGRRTVRIPIRASDVRLQVLTAGLRDVQVQRRTDGGAWVSLGWTTSTSVKRSLPVRHRYDFRFRARDRVGNIGAWSAVVTVRP